MLNGSNVAMIISVHHHGVLVDDHLVEEGEGVSLAPHTAQPPADEDVEELAKTGNVEPTYRADRASRAAW
jgi:hypothetical protein